MATPPPPEDLEDLYEHAPCGYMSLQPDGRIVKCNATLCAWVGYSHDELHGKRLHDLLSVAGRIFFETHFAPLLRMQGYFDEVALDFIARDSTKIPVLANAMERRDDQGALLFTRITIFKATDRRRYERELLEARTNAQTAQRELQALNATLETRIRRAVEERLQIEESLARERQLAELREQFIAILGHDLRNPLASLDGGIRMLHGENLSPQGERVVKLLQGSTLRMSGLIDNILDFARTQLGGGIALKIEDDVEVQPVLEQVVDELRTATPDATIETEFTIPAPMRCDRIRIGQLASNLLGNALAHGHRTSPVRVRANAADGEFVLSVTNAGEPIPPSTMERLFQPFVRGTSGRNQDGLGLGLYIASEIARGHGGTLEAESTAEETRLTFCMPLTGNPVEPD
ncbi:PAS domain-containing sensor histidine kinase [Pseudohoeflea coraliihabitans]|uniref:histidine kinase n=1 Tax=Pseudohoeflea coraliihabitans TaxID=2860393 RepID=A0ABS6WM43_9HYPH|nr:PAS domain-containing sensor histidine kinase [Pseudohoeflea sp. DP4N28-3]MBW3096492.1 PAS domain-containing sensor histidine kinase [Pseudohoeflea sp. DP4N28-3]